MGVKSPSLTGTVSAKLIFPFEEPERAYGESNLKAADGTGWSYYNIGLTTKLRRWTLSFGPMSTTDLSSLIAFVDARKGGYELFYFDHPRTGELDIAVRMVPKTFKHKYLSPNACEASMDVEEFKA